MNGRRMSDYNYKKSCDRLDEQLAHSKKPWWDDDKRPKPDSKKPLEQHLVIGDPLFSAYGFALEDAVVLDGSDRGSLRMLSLVEKMGVILRGLDGDRVQDLQRLLVCMGQLPIEVGILLDSDWRVRFAMVGDKKSVRFGVHHDKFKSKRLPYFIHNHVHEVPSSFSDMDVIAASQWNVQHMVAVADPWVYVMTRPDKDWNTNLEYFEKIKEDWRKIDAENEKEVDRRVRNGESRPKVIACVTHRGMTPFLERYKIPYEQLSIPEAVEKFHSDLSATPHGAPA